LAKIRLTCVFTVASLTNKDFPISRLDCPAAISRSTSASRGVRSFSSVAAAAGGGPPAARDSSFCLTTGSSTDCPAAAASTARPISALVASLVR
jgi:hypothetical protein